MTRSKIMGLSLAVILLGGLGASVSGSPDDAIPPTFIPDGSYVSKNPDGTHPYGASHNIEIGVDVTLDHYEECVAIYVTRSWTRPLGGGAKTYSATDGEIQWDICEEPPVAVLESGSKPGLFGDLIANDDGTYTADYTANGGNERVWHPE
ncbi:MAG: hypothetical protein KDC38_12285 [Planctomycetes bacterium]|nr:hypothetical protein [Planctomycetota bacterium]